MQVLLRNYDNKAYVWKNATYKNGHYYIMDNGLEIQIYEPHIVSVKGMPKNKVMCNHCKELIDDTPEAIEAHFKKSEEKRDCLNCRYIKFDKIGGVANRSINKDECGTYVIKEEYCAKLICRQSTWTYGPIDDERYVHRNCYHFACRRYGVNKEYDFFKKYPGAFDTAITVDHLIAKKLSSDGYSSGYFLYDMKSRGTIKACVNDSGIVECFMLEMSDCGRHYFVYSEKYDKLFYRGGDAYKEDAPYWIKARKIEEMKTKIKKLYEGAK